MDSEGTELGHRPRCIGHGNETQEQFKDSQSDEVRSVQHIPRFCCNRFPSYGVQELRTSSDNLASLYIALHCFYDYAGRAMH